MTVADRAAPLLLADGAVRVDPDGRHVAEVGFLGQHPDRVFACIHRPVGNAWAGVVVCSPFQAELLTNYRREVELARRLAERGIATMRFHPRGAGHSDGDVADMTIGTMTEDARAASAELAALLGVERIGFVGTRLAGLVAAGAARVRPGAPVALWQPSWSGTEYFREVFRARLFADLKAGARTERSDPIADLERAGSVDVLGFTIGRPMYESARKLTLEEALRGTGPVLLVGFDSPGAVDVTPRVEDVHRAGVDISVLRVGENEPWWLISEERVRAPAVATAAVDPTSTWLADRLAGGEHAT